MRNFGRLARQLSFVHRAASVKATTRPRANFRIVKSIPERDVYRPTKDYPDGYAIRVARAVKRTRRKAGRGG